MPRSKAGIGWWTRKVNRSLLTASRMQERFELISISKSFLQLARKLGLTVTAMVAPLCSDMPYLESWNHLVPSTMYRSDKTHWSAPQELMHGVYEGSHKETIDDQEAETTRA